MGSAGEVDVDEGLCLGGRCNRLLMCGGVVMIGFNEDVKLLVVAGVLIFEVGVDEVGLVA